LSFEFIRKIEDFRREIDNLEKVCSNSQRYPDQNFKRYCEAAHTFTENENMILKKIDKITKWHKVDAAIVLESLTAFYEDNCKRIESLSDDLRKLAHECPTKKQKDLSE
jgi:hypothetical protein